MPFTFRSFATMKCSGAPSLTSFGTSSARVNMIGVPSRIVRLVLATAGGAAGIGGLAAAGLAGGGVVVGVGTGTFGCCEGFAVGAGVLAVCCVGRAAGLRITSMTADGTPACTSLMTSGDERLKSVLL